MYPLVRAHWRHLANTIEIVYIGKPREYDSTSVSFAPPTLTKSTTQTANRSVQPFFSQLVADTLQWTPFSSKIAPSHGLSVIELLFLSLTVEALQGKTRQN